MKLHRCPEIFLLYILMQTIMLREFEACGQLQTVLVARITRGHDTHRWPWHAAIYHQVNETDSAYRCGGTLVSSRFILTAAHCVSIAVEEVSVLLGRLHLNACHSSAPFIKVDRILAHPNYNPENFENDIAVVTLSNDAIFDSYVQPICMWRADKTDLSEVIGRFGTVVGWGLTADGKTANVLQEASLPVISSFTCLMSNRDLFGRFLTNANFCAGTRNGTSVCTGDSGGSITFQEDGRFYIRGIVSVGADKLDRNTNKFMCDSTQYAIFTDVAQYLPWIAEATGKTVCETDVHCIWIQSNICAVILNVEESERKCKIMFDETSRADARVLRVFGNGSTAVPDVSSALDKFVKLETLFLSNFKLVKRCRLTPFKNISGLALDVAQFDADTFVDLNMLESLWIINNNLTTLPTGIFRKNHKIRELHLFNNHLIELHPDVFEKLPNVKELRLNYNKIETLPANVFRNNEKMRELFLQNNILKEVHEDLFNGLKNLEKLDLSYNQIESIHPGLFRSNVQLIQVDLSNNKIDKIEIDFNSMPQLSKFILSGNRCIDELFTFPTQSVSEVNDKISENCAIVNEIE